MAKLAPTQSLREYPHCGSVMQAYVGNGHYYRRFDGYHTDNSVLRYKVSKRAFCSECEIPLACWDEATDPDAYGKDNSRDRYA